MPLDVIKDFSIIMFMLTGIFVMIVFTAFGIKMYRKISKTVNSIQSTLKSTEETAKFMTDNLLKPVIGGSIASFATHKIFKFFFGRGSG